MWAGLHRGRVSLALSSGIVLVLVVSSGCGSGTAAIVGAASGDSGGGNAQTSVSTLRVDSGRSAPATILFTLSDPEGDPARLTLQYERPGRQRALLTAVAANPVTLPTSASGIEHSVSWHFEMEDELPDDGSLVQEVRVLLSVEGGPQEAMVVADLGNDPPRVLAALAPLEETTGIVLTQLMVSDSSADVVSIRVEYDVLGDDPDQGWRLARASQDEATQEFGIRGLQASPDGVPAPFFWDSSVDLGNGERDVQLRFTARDEDLEGPARTTLAFHVDNNTTPVLLPDAGGLILNPDRRRGIPLPFSVVDAEGDDVRVLVQWARLGEPFPDLGGLTPREIPRLLENGLERKRLQLATPFPLAASGLLEPIDA